VMQPITSCILIDKRDMTSIKIYEIQGNKGCLSMAVSIGPPCVHRVENRSITHSSHIILEMNHIITRYFTYTMCG
jgi:hypothetical protein